MRWKPGAAGAQPCSLESAEVTRSGLFDSCTCHPRQRQREVGARRPNDRGHAAAAAAARAARTATGPARVCDRCSGTGSAAAAAARPAQAMALAACQLAMASRTSSSRYSRRVSPPPSHAFFVLPPAHVRPPPFRQTQLERLPQRGGRRRIGRARSGPTLAKGSRTSPTVSLAGRGICGIPVAATRGGLAATLCQRRRRNTPRNAWRWAAKTPRRMKSTGEGGKGASHPLCGRPRRCDKRERARPSSLPRTPPPSLASSPAAHPSPPTPAVASAAPSEACRASDHGGGLTQRPRKVGEQDAPSHLHRTPGQGRSTHRGSAAAIRWDTLRSGGVV